LGRALATPLEYVEIVAGDEPEEIVVVARAIGPFAPNDEAGVRELVRRRQTNSRLDCRWRRLAQVWDKAAISVSLLADLSLSLDADVFTQVNAEGNRSILKALLAAGDFQSSDRVLELYCGGVIHFADRAANQRNRRGRRLQGVDRQRQAQCAEK